MNNKQNEELQSRREFFKKAAKAALPVVGAVVLSSIPMQNVSASPDRCSGCTDLCTGCTGCTGGCGGCTSCTGCTGCSLNCYGGNH